MPFTKSDLRNLIKEELQKITENSFGSSPKCIFVGGSAGAGKGTLIQTYIPKGFKVINSDDEYEKLLKRADIGMRQKDFDGETLSKASKLQAKARKSTSYRLQHSIDKDLDIIIDGTAASYNPIKKQKDELEKLGYETFMIVVFVSPLISLQRNMLRGDLGGRELQPDIVLRTWLGLRENIKQYDKLFGKHFSIIDNNPDDTINDFNKEMIQPYFSKKDKKLKPKTPDEIQKRKEQKQKMYDEISKLVKQIPKTDSVSQMKSKLNSFLNK